MAFTDFFNVPGSPHWWLLRLDRKLEERNQAIGLYESYYEGDQRLAFAMSKYRQAFADLFQAFASNWCKLTVDVAVERMSIDGFRFGKDQQGDKAAWRIWQVNGLDADSVLAHTEAVKCGDSYLIVQPGDDDLPSITVEHPTQVIVAYAEGSRRKRAAGLKKWLDETTGKVYATVYLSSGIYRFERAAFTTTTVQAALDFAANGLTAGAAPGVAPNAPLILPTGTSVSGWQERARVSFEETNPLRVVPVVPMSNDPHLIRGGRSDLDDVIPLQDAINKTITDMLVDSEYHGFPQRWATGVEIPKDPVTGEPRTDVFLASSGSVWTVADENAKFGQFALGDLGMYEKAANLLVRHLSAQTRTPPHYLVGEIVNASGDALKAAETGLKFKTERKRQVFGESWEEAIRLAFGLMGEDAKAKAFDAETIWGESESRSWGELVDAAVKMHETLAVPFEVCWEFLGFTQQQIDRMKTALPDSPPPADPIVPGPVPAPAAT